MKTEFAAPKRASDETLVSEIEHARDLPLVRDLTHLITDAFAILNPCRQIVYCNSGFLDMTGMADPKEIYGKRLGEALDCVHSGKTESGCGTTVFCRYCGAANAVVKSQETPDSIKEEECRLVTGMNNQSHDFRIRANTIELSNVFFTLVFVKDISHEKRRHVLERIFFHDILNTAGGIQGVIELMKEASEDELDDLIELAGTSSHTLIEEIHAQRDLLAAENENLEIEMIGINSMDILSSVAAVYKNHAVAMGKTIRIDPESVSMTFTSDPRLLVRILGNMSKNALEAEPCGQVVSIGSREQDGRILFWVHNPTEMPEQAKLQMFQRSFSTKGSARGLGTYSIKLLGEKYLKGKISFTSERQQGTLFLIELPAGSQKT